MAGSFDFFAWHAYVGLFFTWKETRDCGRQLKKIGVAGVRANFLTTVSVVKTWMRAAKAKAAPSCGNTLQKRTPETGYIICFYFFVLYDMI